MIAPDKRAPTDPGIAEDSASLELLYRSHFQWLLKIVRLRFGREHAEDLVQDTYLRVSAYKGKAISSPRALLLKIATRAAIDSARRASARPVLRSAEEPVGISAADQAETLMLKQVILTLPAHVRSTFLLSRVAGLSYEEISEHQGIALKTVEWRMTKALKLCAEKLRD